MRILVADDAAIECAILRRFAEGEGHEIVGTTTDAQSLVERTRELFPDLVVLDMRLPPSGGLHALAMLRAQATPPAIVVIAALGERPVLQSALHSGAQGGLLRPLDATEFAATLERLARTT